ncbi:helix-turn-helix transcriptional regulator [Halomarina ordinaria]|uniref:Helix-turn-helix transcriptional regulator n=1 Tax=Halomarina ordinaria TaxID=3033939 RepID=A0ABD5U6W0_9EURY|nr:helix-turn-helix domain-containing protein [Halomarina sp. PSRA2]
MSRALGVWLLAVFLVVSAVPGGGAAAQSEPTPEFDRTTFDIEVMENGSARWTFEYSQPLETSADRSEFETFAAEFNESEQELYTDFQERARTLTTTGSEQTGRQMFPVDFERQAYVTPLGNKGVVEMSFRWEGFALVSDDRVVVGDVFDGGLYLAPNQRLQMSWDDDRLTYVSASPDADQQTSETVIWEAEDGGTQFYDEQPGLTLESPNATNESDTDDEDTPDSAVEGVLSPMSIGALLAALALCALALVRFDVVDRLGDDGDGGSEGTGDGAGGDSPGDGSSGGDGPGPPTTDAGVETSRDVGDDTDAEEGPDPVVEPGGPSEAADIPDELLLTDEDRVLRLLEENGGRMRQVDIVEGTDWSKSKVSMLLSDMEDDGLVNKLRVGRENIVSRDVESGSEPPSSGDDE